MAKILFVDDYELLARISCEVLRLVGFDAECVCRSEDALHRLKSKAFDIIIIDHDLANVDGFTLSHWVRQSDPFIPIIRLIDDSTSTIDPMATLTVSKAHLFPEVIEAIEDALSRAAPRRFAASG